MDGRRVKKILLLLIAGFFAILLSGSILGIYFSPRLKAEMEELISERTGHPVRIESFDWSVWPVLQFKGQGLTVGSSQARDSLFVYVDTMKIQARLSGLLVSPRTVKSVMLNESLIRIPPRSDRRKAQVRPAASVVDTDSQSASIPVIVEQLNLRNAAVEILPGDPEKLPRIIEIRQFTMQGLALGQSSHYSAEVRYPHPEGDVIVSGQFGPFNREDPILTPVSGQYKFQDADLSAFREISGILTSTGEFSGDLGENQVVGSAQIPDFQVVKAQNITPLDVTFQVNRIAGDVYLRNVETSFLQSHLITKGEIRRRTERNSRIVILQVSSREAKVEDLFRFALKGDKPPLTGPIELDTAVTIPSGKGKVLQRMIIDGEFRIREGEFTNPDFQKKLAQISKFGRKDRDQEVDNRTFSDLNGTFRLENEIIRFTQLHFGVPGMFVSLKGTYGLDTEQMDFRGNVNLDRSVSEMTKGRLSEWLSVLDLILRSGKAGTSVPIRIQGNRSSPSVSLDF